MARQITNYRRFYAAFNKLQKHGSDEDVKASLVSQWTGGRTTHLHEMQPKEYTNCCKALENMLGYGEQRKRHRSICLHLMQELGIDTKDWQRINDFCQHPRICGKVFALLDIAELEALELKLRAIKNKGGLNAHARRARATTTASRATTTASRATTTASRATTTAARGIQQVQRQILIIQNNNSNGREQATTSTGAAAASGGMLPS